MSAWHLLCAPFPSPQGTQAAVATMLEAEASAQQAGSEAPRLIAYAESYGPSPRRFSVERLPAIPWRIGARSGPSLARVAHDVGAVARLRLRREPGVIFAHNVEAAAVCAAAGRDYVYVAHTSMREELPSYGGDPRLRARLGEGLDLLAASRATAIAAVCPSLADALSARLGRTVMHLPVPWSVPPAIDAEERARARVALALDDSTTAVLHAGNLDAYQGLEQLLGACGVLARSRGVRLILATASDPRAFASRARAAGIPLTVLPLGDEGDRRLAHAAADVAIVTRSVPFGLPIKLLEALARGVPVACTQRSAAGLALHQVAEVVADEGSFTHELADAAMRAIAPTTRPLRTSEGRAWVQRTHGADAYLAARARILRAIR